MRVAAIFSRLVAAFNLEQSNVINGGVLLGSKGKNSFYAIRIIDNVN